MKKLRRAVVVIQAVLIATAWTLPVQAKPAAQQQLKPVLQAIDPSQARVDDAPPEQPAAPPAQPQQPAYQPPPQGGYQPPPQGGYQPPPQQGAPNQGLEQMIPEFGKPNPVVPPSMATPMPPGPGFASGYAPVVPNATLQAAPGSQEDPRVARLEQIAFGSTYPEHDTDDRIEHLEREVFSKVFEGDPESRIQRLQAKLNPQGAFGAPPARPNGYQPVAANTGYRPQPPQYQPSYQPPPQQQAPPQQQQPQYQQPYQPPQQPALPAYVPPQQQQQQQQQPPQQQQSAPPSIPQQPYQPQQQPYQQPQQQYYQPQQFQPPPSIPQQPYQPPQQQAWQQPQQQGYPSGSLPYPPGGGTPPQTVPQSDAPPSIPQGPITMQTFNRPQQPPPQQQPPQQQAPPSIPQQPPQQVASRPPQQQSNPYAQPSNPAIPPASAAGGSNMGGALENMAYDKKAGDYSASILRLGGSFARWTNLPVRVHIPMNTPDNWRQPIDAAVKKWAQFLPTVIAPPSESADIEVGWINHLSPRQLGITNLEIFNGRPRVTVYLLRPSYYPPDVPETTLQKVAMHQMGHALGLFGHSANAGDIMFAIDGPVKPGAVKSSNISQRDVNTLRRIYESAPLPDGFQSPQPISWP